MLRFATFLSPLLHSTYEYIAHYIGEHVCIPTVLNIGQSVDEFAAGQVDVGFICGLLYARRVAEPDCPLEPLAAPVLCSERYRSQPIYFSDVIVRRDSPCTTFDALEGCVWAYNERASHSGYNIVYYSLLQRHKTLPYFGTLIETGAHLASLQAVLDGKAEAAAIDSHVLDIWRLRNPELAEQLRIIDMLGPSPIPPIVISTRLDNDLKRSIQQVLLAMHHDPFAANELRAGLIEQFVAAGKKDYEGMIWF